MNIHSPKDSEKSEGWHELAYAGVFVDPKSKQKFEIGDEEFLSWQERFNDLKASNATIPVVKQHSTDFLDRVGTVEDVQIRDTPRKSFWVKMSMFDPSVVEAVNRSSLSVYSRSNMVDSNGKEYKHGILHVGVTDYPVIKGLQKDLALSIIFEKDLEQPDISEEKGEKMKEFALALGLAETATEEEILAEVNKLKAPKSNKAIALSLGLAEDATEDAIIASMAELKGSKEALKNSRLNQIKNLKNVSAEVRENLTKEVDAPNFDFLLSLIPTEKPDFQTGDQNQKETEQQFSLVDAVRKHRGVTE